MDSKSTAFLAVALVIGLAIGAAAGFFLWGNNGGDDGKIEYWFYIDYGDKADETHTDEWISGKGTNALEALQSVATLDVNGTMVNGINGVAPDYATDGTYWTLYIYNGQYDANWATYGGMVMSGLGIDQVKSTVLMFAVTDGTANPNLDQGYMGWIGTGPLAPA